MTQHIFITIPPKKTSGGVGGGGGGGGGCTCLSVFYYLLLTRSLVLKNDSADLHCNSRTFKKYFTIMCFQIP